MTRAVVSVFAAVLLPLAAADPDAAKREARQISEPAKVDATFKPVGEYQGGEGAARIALRLTTWGPGAYRALAYVGGLPGDGWDGQTRAVLPGTPAGSGVALAGDGWTATWQDDAISGTTAAGAAFRLARLVRTSPTLGAPPPAGAIVLFDGKPNDRWEKPVSGALMGCGGTTRDAYPGAFTFHAEFMTPWFPDTATPGRDTNFAFQGAPRSDQRWGDNLCIVAITQAFAVDAPSPRGCGALIPGIAPARVDACLPPLAWQTYDIDYAPGAVEGERVVFPRVSVRHNGVLIHDDVELPTALKDKKAGTRHPPPPAGVRIHTASHGLSAKFRNVWLLPRTAVAR